MKSTWGSDLYGNPCRECGFSWSITLDEGVTLMTHMSVEYRRTLLGATGKEQHPRLSWSVAAYVCHVADNLRIWAERLAGIAAGDPPEVGRYDDNLLAQARQYEMISLEAALWSLEQSIASWQLAVEQAAATEVVLVHPEYGTQTVHEVVRSNAHDTAHHLWDIRRSRMSDGIDATGTVKTWRYRDGWGVLVSPEVVGTVFAHFGSIDMEGYRELHPGQHVMFRYRTPGQDGCDHTATYVSVQLQSHFD